MGISTNRIERVVFGFCVFVFTGVKAKQSICAFSV